MSEYRFALAFAPCTMSLNSQFHIAARQYRSLGVIQPRAPENPASTRSSATGFSGTGAPPCQLPLARIDAQPFSAYPMFRSSAISRSIRLCKAHADPRLAAASPFTLDVIVSVLHFSMTTTVSRPITSRFDSVAVRPRRNKTSRPESRLALAPSFFGARKWLVTATCESLRGVLKHREYYGDAFEKAKGPSWPGSAGSLVQKMVGPLGLEPRTKGL